MKTEYIKLKNGINIIVLLFLLFSCCNKNSKDFELTRFTIVNEDLDSLLLKTCTIIENKIMVCNFTDHEYLTYKKDTIKTIDYYKFMPNISDTVVAIGFIDKNDLLMKYIYDSNRKIIGYTTKNERDIVLLTDIEFSPKFHEYFGHWMRPEKSTKKFDYLYFPADLYKKRKWEESYSIYEPMMVFCRFNNDTLVGQPIWHR